MRKFLFIFPIILTIAIFAAFYIFLMKGKSGGDEYGLQLAPRSELYNKKFGYKNAYLTKDVSTSGNITNVRINLMPGTSEPVIIAGKNNSLFAFCNNYQSHGTATMFVSEDGGMNWQEIDVPLSEKGKNVFYADPYATIDEAGNVYYTAVETDNASKFKLIYNKYDIESKKWFDNAVIVQESNVKEVKFDKPKILFANNELLIAYIKKEDNDETLWLAKIKDGKTDIIGITDEETESASLNADKSGNLYCVYLKEKTELFIKTSKDNGITWSEENLVAEFEMPGRKVNKSPVIKFGNNMGIRVNSDPQTAIYNDEIYVAYCAKGDKDNSNIYFTKGNVNNLEFSEPVLINNDNSTTDQFLPALCIGENDKIYVVYQDSRDDNMNVLVNAYCSFSDNGGASFKDIKLSTKDFNPYEIVLSGIYMGDYNSAVISGDNLVSVWTDGRNKNFDIYASIVPLSALK